LEIGICGNRKVGYLRHLLLEIVPGRCIHQHARTPGSTGVARGDEIELSKLIDILNERFGTDFRPGDQLFFESIREDAVSDSKHLLKEVYEKIREEAEVANDE
jgi:hypothetical protein